VIRVVLKSGGEESAFRRRGLEDSSRGGFEARIVDRTAVASHCQSPGCARCLRSPEPATLHTDCFELFRRECTAEDKLLRLWTAAVWRYPWPGALPLGLGGPLPAASPEAIRRVVSMCGLPLLASLPREIIDMIWQHAQPDLVDRYSFIIHLARELSQPAPAECSTGPLVHLSAWEREKPPREARQSRLGFVMRLTIDTRGIREVEKLPSMPAYEGQRSDTEVFVVQADTTLARLYAQQSVPRSPRNPLPITISIVANLFSIFAPAVSLGSCASRPGLMIPSTLDPSSGFGTRRRHLNGTNASYICGIRSAHGSAPSLCAR